MSLQQSDPILIFERISSGANLPNGNFIRNALLFGFNTHPDLRGANGEPAVVAVYLNLAAAHAAGSADWHNALIRKHDVVHTSHKDWIEGRTQIAYEERPEPEWLEPRHLVAARAAHEVNRVLCFMYGDFSQPAWADAPVQQKDRIIAGALSIKADPTQTPEESHNSWMATMLSEGWTFAPEKNVDLKQHPALLPWNQLDPRQKIKDFAFGAVTRAVYDYPQLPPTILEPDAEPKFPTSNVVSIADGASGVTVSSDSAAETTNLVNQLEELEKEAGVAGTPGSMEAMTHEDSGTTAGATGGATETTPQTEPATA